MRPPRQNLHSSRPPPLSSGAPSTSANSALVAASFIHEDGTLLNLKLGVAVVVSLRSITTRIAPGKAAPESRSAKVAVMTMVTDFMFFELVGCRRMLDRKS